MAEPEDLGDDCLIKRLTKLLILDEMISYIIILINTNNNVACRLKIKLILSYHLNLGQ